MSKRTVRQQFEAWAKRKGLGIYRLGSSYWYSNTRDAWDAYRAGLRAGKRKGEK